MLVGLPLQTMTPMALDVALTVQQEIHTRLDEVDRMRHKQLERARYETDLAQRRYMYVDPAGLAPESISLVLDLEDPPRSARATSNPEGDSRSDPNHEPDERALGSASNP